MVKYMKKKFPAVCSVLIMIAAMILSACFIADNDTDGALAAPSVNTADSDPSFKIAVTPIPGMKYANILRQKCGNPDFDSEIGEITTENIGQIIPKETPNQESVSFNDSYTQPGTYYRYAVRYYDGETYTTTLYSTAEKKDTMEGRGTGEAEIEAQANLSYMRNDKTNTYTLDIGSDVIIPKGFETLALVIDNGNGEKPFFIKTQIEVQDGEDSATLSAEALSGLNLTDFLTDDFYDVPLSIKGLIAITNAQKNIQNRYTIYYWTPRYEIAPDDVSITYIDINGETQEAEYIIVPKKSDITNDLDCSTT